ncbi:MAG: diguanylate cyclase [Coriobacteriia bacterium]|nr:diguanylate cyclase [Coriobacteriia bacterium]
MPARLTSQAPTPLPLATAEEHALGAILTAEVETARPDELLSKILSRMETRRISCIIIVDDEFRPVGIFTERDAVRHLATCIPTEGVPVSDAMSRPPLTSTPEVDYRDAYQLIARHNFRHLVVVDENHRVAGLVTESDFINHMGLQYLVERTAVGAAMNPRIPSLDGDSTLADAASLMESNKASCLVVTDGPLPLGMLTERDVVRIANTGVATGTTLVEDVMKGPVISIDGEANVRQAMDKMDARGIRRLVVVDDAGGLLGVLTRHDIVKAMLGRYVELLNDTDELQREAYLISIIENQPGLVWLKDIDGRVLAANRAFAEAHGHQRPADVIGLTDEDLWPADIAQERREINSRVLATSEPETFEECADIDGVATWTETTITPVHDVQGDAIGIVGFAHDSTDRRLGELLAQARLDLMALALSGTPEDVMRATVDAAERLTGSAIGFFHLVEVGRASAPITVFSTSASAQWGPGVADAGELRLDRGLWARCFDSQEPIVCNDVAAEGVHPAIDGHIPLERLLVVPVMAGNDVSALVGLGNKAAPYTDADIQLVTGFLGIAIEITRRTLDGQRLRQAAAVLENSQEGMFVVDSGGLTVMINRAFSDLTGYSEERIIGKRIEGLFDDTHEAWTSADLPSMLSATGKWRGEMTLMREGGGSITVLTSISAVSSPSGTITHYAGTFTDISESKLAEEEMRRLALFDPLTGLANRRLLGDRLEQALIAGTRTSRHGALLMVDLDEFKRVNDTCGHHVGDLVLREVGTRISSLVREGDTVARIGGDEFVVILTDLDRDAERAIRQAEKIAHKMRKRLRAPYADDPSGMSNTASIGVALFWGKDVSAADLTRCADVAMYQAKTSGRDAVRSFDTTRQSA